MTTTSDYHALERAAMWTGGNHRILELDAFGMLYILCSPGGLKPDADHTIIPALWRHTQDLLVTGTMRSN